MAKIKNHEEWLKKRLEGIGGSEASAIIGKNPYMNNQVLWELKVGLKEHEDIGNKPYVKYGKEAEAPLRELFKLDYPKFEVIYKSEFDLVRHPDHPFIFATLDGRLVEKETGRIGVLEIKTTEILRSMQKEKWNQGIPDNYYIQVLWQLLATGYDFAVLKAQLKYQYSGEVRTEAKHYFIERSEVQADIDYLEEAGIKFWKHVENNTRPPLILPEI